MSVISLLRVALIAIIGLATFPSVAQVEPKPLGVPLGATVEEARKALKPNELTEIDTNRFSNGPMFTTSGTGLGVQDLQKVLLVFDTEGRMVMLQMTMSAGGMGKPAFDRVLGHLKKQYRSVAIENPFVGNKSAVFETPATRIDVDAPHLSFEMTVSYMTKPFYTAVKRTLDEERMARRKTESGRF